MIQAQLYRSDGRDCEQSDIFRRLATLHSQTESFGRLTAVHDETLAGSNHRVRLVEQSGEIVLIPLVGGMLYKDSLGNEDIVGTEEIRIFSATEGQYYQLVNPYKKEPINYLQIWIDAPELATTKSEQRPFTLQKNTLVSLFAPIEYATAAVLQTTKAYGSLGLFGGRKQATYQLHNPENGLFAFVVNGAFEFENRLIESRDGLALQGITIAEFEALSENAILLILEIPMR